MDECGMCDWELQCIFGDFSHNTTHTHTHTHTHNTTHTHTPTPTHTHTHTLTHHTHSHAHTHTHTLGAEYGITSDGFFELEALPK